DYGFSCVNSLVPARGLAIRRGGGGVRRGRIGSLRRLRGLVVGRPASGVAGVSHVEEPPLVRSRVHTVVTRRLSVLTIVECSRREPPAGPVPSDEPPPQAVTIRLRTRGQARSVSRSAAQAARR